MLKNLLLCAGVVKDSIDFVRTRAFFRNLKLNELRVIFVYEGALPLFFFLLLPKLRLHKHRVENNIFNFVLKWRPDSHVNLNILVKIGLSDGHQSLVTVPEGHKLVS